VFDVAIILPVAAGLGAASWYLLEQPLMKRAARASQKSPTRYRSQARTIALANPRP
jgi:peptidoglycan/LPS O-acetylase OafA/YrhL